MNNFPAASSIASVQQRIARRIQAFRNYEARTAFRIACLVRHSMTRNTAIGAYFRVPFPHLSDGLILLFQIVPAPGVSLRKLIPHPRRYTIDR